MQDLFICPELADFSKEFKRAMRDNIRTVRKSWQDDPDNYWFSDLSLAYCGL